MRTGVALVAALCACATAPRPASSLEVRVGEEFRLAPGQRAAVQGEPLALRFAAVVEDSRCPVGVRCVRAGGAKVRVELRGRRPEGEDVVLATAPGRPQYASFGRYDVHLVALDPPRRSDVARPRYVATLRVTRH